MSDSELEQKFLRLTDETLGAKRARATLQLLWRLEDIREDLAARQAVELIASEAKPIPIEQAQAREKLWTPESERGQGEDGGEPAAARLWTPER